MKKLWPGIIIFFIVFFIISGFTMVYIAVTHPPELVPQGDEWKH